MATLTAQSAQPQRPVLACIISRWQESVLAADLYSGWMNAAADQWARELGEWAVPQDILDQAPRAPFVFPPEMFAAPPSGEESKSRSTQLARERLVGGGSVLDIGCGGGAAAFAAAPPATHLIGSDRQEDMTKLFASTAAERGLSCETYAGPWPDVAEQVPVADVVVSHNVLYNVPDIVSFARAAHEHARHRVVLEVTEFHPQTVRKPLWRHFWNLERPGGPTADVAVAALREAGLPALCEPSVATPRNDQRASMVDAAFWCRQLCLPQDRADEVAELVAELEFPKERVTIWWDR